VKWKNFKIRKLGNADVYHVNELENF